MGESTPPGGTSAGAERQALPRLRPGAQVGNYVVERCLGSGGQASVFLARDTVLRRRIALKVFGEGTRLEGNRRAVREARLIAALDHPNIVRVLHVELESGVWHVAMEYVDGGTVEERVRAGGPLPLPAALGFLRTAADALASAHRQGVLHCDLKPQNLLLTRDGVLKLADFGLAGLRSSLSQRSPGRIGTPQYMAPEVWLGESPSVRSDLYSLGATFFFMLAGTPPYGTGAEETLRRAHLEGVLALPDATAPGPARLMRSCLARSPEARPASAEALRDEVSRVFGQLADRRTARTPPAPSLLASRPWTADAQRLAAEYGAAGRVVLPVLLHNAIRIAELHEMGLVTSWCVEGASSCRSPVQALDELPGAWRTRPQRWPEDALLTRLARLRDDQSDRQNENDAAADDGPPNERGPKCSRT